MDDSRVLASRSLNVSVAFSVLDTSHKLPKYVKLPHPLYKDEARRVKQLPQDLVSRNDETGNCSSTSDSYTVLSATCAILQVGPEK